MPVLYSMKNSIIYIDKLYRRKKYTEKHMKIIKDTNAVSPVVASLMLIMVVAGSVTFLAGMMQNMNSQADQVAGKSTSADRTSMKINIISSDLAMPAVEPLVKAYNDKHTGVMLQLQKSETLDMTSNALYFVTRGNPSLVDSFIEWARSSEGQDIIEKNGYISYTREFN